MSKEQHQSCGNATLEQMAVSRQQKFTKLVQTGLVANGRFASWRLHHKPTEKQRQYSTHRRSQYKRKFNAL
jgi:hypothetical protein